MKFSDLKFEDNGFGGEQARHSFDPYTLSVVNGYRNAGAVASGRPDLYEIAVLKDDEFVQISGIHNTYYDNVVAWLTEKDVEDIMKKLAFIAFSTVKEDIDEV